MIIYLSFNLKESKKTRKELHANLSCSTLKFILENMETKSQIRCFNKVLYPIEARMVVMSYVSKEYITLSSTLITS